MGGASGARHACARRCRETTRCRVAGRAPRLPGRWPASGPAAGRGRLPMSSTPEHGVSPGQVDRLVDVAEATRQLELAAHDVAVAATCIGLGDLDEAHINVITARAATDAAEEILRVVLASGPSASHDL